MEICNQAKGLIAEIKFKEIALQHGWMILEPCIDTKGYDFVLDIDGKFIKIQIKSSFTSRVSNRGYKTVKFSMKRGSSTRGFDSQRCYDKGDFDFVCCYSGVFNSWYIIPFSELYTDKMSKEISIYPNRSGSKWTKFQNAWGLIAASFFFAFPIEVFKFF